MPTTEMRPALDGRDQFADKVSVFAPFIQVLSWEKPEPGLLRSNVAGRHVMFATMAVSLLIHAGFIAATFALMLASRQVPPPYSRDIYVTLASGGPGISAGDGSYSGSGQERHMHLPKVSSDIGRLHRAVRQITTHLPKVARLAPSGAKPSTVVTAGAAPAFANADTSDSARIFLGHEGNDSGAQTGWAGGEGSAGSVSAAAVQAPVLVARVIPNYPEGARRLGIEGEVVLQFVVDQSGRVERKIEVVASLPMLDQAAIDAVRQWRFSPGRDRDGNPVRVLVSVPLQFTLR